MAQDWQKSRRQSTGTTNTTVAGKGWQKSRRQKRQDEEAARLREENIGRINDTDILSLGRGPIDPSSITLDDYNKIGKAPDLSITPDVMPSYADTARRLADFLDPPGASSPNDALPSNPRVDVQPQRRDQYNSELRSVDSDNYSWHDKLKNFFSDAKDKTGEALQYAAGGVMEGIGADNISDWFDRTANGIIGIGQSDENKKAMGLDKPRESIEQMKARYNDYVTGYKNNNGSDAQPLSPADYFQFDRGGLGISSFEDMRIKGAEGARDISTGVAKGAEFTGYVAGMIPGTIGAAKTAGTQGVKIADKLLQSAPNWLKVAGTSVAGAAGTGLAVSGTAELGQEMGSPDEQGLGGHLKDVGTTTGYFAAYGAAAPLASKIMGAFSNKLPATAQALLHNLEKHKVGSVVHKVGEGVTEGAITGAMVGAGIGTAKALQSGDPHEFLKNFLSESKSEMSENLVEALTLGIARRFGFGGGNAVMSSGDHGVNSNHDPLESIKNDVMSSMGDEDKADWNQAITDAAEQGIPQDQAESHLWGVYADTEQGTKAVENAVQRQINNVVTAEQLMAKERAATAQYGSQKSVNEAIAGLTGQEKEIRRQVDPLGVLEGFDPNFKAPEDPGTAIVPLNTGKAIGPREDFKAGDLVRIPGKKGVFTISDDRAGKKQKVTGADGKTLDLPPQAFKRFEGYKPGDQVQVSGREGAFTIQDLRDGKNIRAVDGAGKAFHFRPEEMQAAIGSNTAAAVTEQAPAIQPEVVSEPEQAPAIQPEVVSEPEAVPRPPMTVSQTISGSGKKLDYEKTNRSDGRDGTVFRLTSDDGRQIIITQRVDKDGTRHGFGVQVKDGGKLKWSNSVTFAGLDSMDLSKMDETQIETALNGQDFTVTDRNPAHDEWVKGETAKSGDKRRAIDEWSKPTGRFNPTHLLNGNTPVEVMDMGNGQYAFKKAMPAGRTAGIHPGGQDKVENFTPIPDDMYAENHDHSADAAAKEKEITRKLNQGKKGATTVKEMRAERAAETADMQERIKNAKAGDRIKLKARGEAFTIKNVRGSLMDLVNDKDTELKGINRKAIESVLDSATPEAQEQPVETPQEKPSDSPKQEPAAQEAQETTVSEPEKEESNQTPEVDSRLGGKTTVKTEEGNKVDVQYAVFDADDLIISNHPVTMAKNEKYPEDLQPRDRTRASSEGQINRILQKLEPEFLGKSPKTSEGAPIIGPDGVVESGNGRSMALARGYQNGAKQMEAYKEWLKTNIISFGLKPSQIEGIAKPVLVRVRRSEMTMEQRAQFAKDSNQSNVAAMSPVEQAQGDAKKLTGELLAMFESGDEMKVTNAANRPFVNLFMRDVVGNNERGQYLDSQGNLNQEGETRIENAILARTYGNTQALSRMIESTDENEKNIKRAMVDAAPALVKVKEGAESGTLYPLDITDDISSAMLTFSDIRKAGQSVDFYMDQGDLFEPISRESLHLLMIFDQNKRSAAKIRNFLHAYADIVDAAGDPNQFSLIDEPIPTKEEALLAAVKKAGVTFETANEGTLFQSPPVSGEQAAPESGETGAGEETKPAEAEEVTPEAPLWKYEEYNDWSRMLAKQHTKKEIEKMLNGAGKELTKATESHLRAIEKTTSMQSNSQRRAQSRNNVSGGYEKKNALENALEIYNFYPEQTKEGVKTAEEVTPSNTKNDEIHEKPTRKVKTDPKDTPEGTAKTPYENMADFNKKLTRGEVTTAKEIQDQYAYLTDNKDKVIQSIFDRIKADPKHKRRQNKTIQEMAENTFDSAIDKLAAADSETLSYILDFSDPKGSRQRQTERKIAALTDESIQAYNAKKDAERDSHKKSMENPETLAELRHKKVYGGTFTTEEQRLWDELNALAMKDQEKAKPAPAVTPAASVTGGTYDFDIKEGKHTKTGEALWIVNAKGERLGKEEYSVLRSKMKEIGGHWSNFKPNVGFLFKSDPTEKLAALSGGEVATPSEEEAAPEQPVNTNAKKTADKLRGLADNMQNKINDLRRDRPTHTHRMASMAASANDEADAMQRMQGIMRNIAQAIEDGTATHLDGITARTHIETLEHFMQQLRYKRFQKSDHKIRWEDFKEKGSLQEDIDSAEYPKPMVHIDHIRDMMKGLDGVKGVSRARAAIDREISRQTAKDGSSFTERTYLIDVKNVMDELNVLITRTTNTNAADATKRNIEDYKRIKTMGLDTPEQLRAALREYVQYRQGTSISPEEKKARELKLKEGELARSGIVGFFPTPKTIVEQMLDHAALENGMIVLEPSAGKGDIADAIKEAEPGVTLHIVEYNNSLASLLSDKGYEPGKLAGTDEDISDFMQHPTVQVYDRVIMNPPFENGQDIDHVRHAYALLKPGGRVVAIMSEGPFYRSDKKATAFREWLDEYGTSEELGDAFATAERRTGTRTRMVVIDKPVDNTPVQEDKPDYMQTNAEATAAARAELERRKNLPINDMATGSGISRKKLSDRQQSKLDAERSRDSVTAGLDIVNEANAVHEAAVRAAARSGKLEKAQYDAIHKNHYGEFEAFISPTGPEVAKLEKEKREERKAAMQDKIQENIQNMQPGGKVRHAGFGQMGTVIKVNAKSFRVEIDGVDTKETWPKDMIDLASLPAKEPKQEENAFDKAAYGINVEKEGGGIGIVSPGFRGSSAPKSKKNPNPFPHPDPEVEAKYQASHGAPKESLWHKASEKFSSFKKKWREFEHLPKIAKYEHLRQKLLSLQNGRDAALHKALQIAIHDITRGLSRQQFRLFERYVIVLDQYAGMKNGDALNFGDTAENLLKYKESLEQHIANEPKVQSSIEKRSVFWKQVKEDYFKAMSDIGVDVSDKLTREDYFRHQVIAKAQEKRSADGSKLKAPDQAGWMRQRSGEFTGEINTDYLEAEAEVMVDMIFNTEKARVLNIVNKEHNREKEFKAMVEQIHDDAIQEIINKEKATNPQQQTIDGEPTTFSETEIALDSFRKKIGWGFAELSQMDKSELWQGDNGEYAGVVASMGAKSGSTMGDGKLFEYISKLADRNGDLGQVQALRILGAIADRKAFKKALLEAAGKWTTLEKLVKKDPELVPWQPKDGSIFFSKDPGAMAHDVFMNLMSSFGVDQNEADDAFRRINKALGKPVMVMGGKRPQWIIPADVAMTLDNLMVDNASKITIFRVHKAVTRQFKKFVLTGPRNFTSYNIRNTSSDLDKTIAGNPAGLRFAPKAAHELFQVMAKKSAGSPELREYINRGGLQNLQQIAEMGDVKHLSFFAKFYKGTNHQQNTFMKIWDSYWNRASAVTNYREAIMRYANYLSYLDQIQKNGGKPKNYGASNRVLVNALQNPRDQAFKLANELMVDYNATSTIGREIADTGIPFFRWMEGNLKSTFGVMKNAWMDGHLSATVGRKLLGKVAFTAPALTYQTGKLALKLMVPMIFLNLWNYMFWRDQEEKLPMDVRESFHLIYGVGADGKTRYIGRLGFIEDFLDWFGLDDGYTQMRAIMDNEKTLGQVIKSEGQGILNKPLQGLNPIFKLIVQAPSGLSFYPDAFNPSHNHPWYESFLDLIGARKDFASLKAKFIDGAPTRPFSPLDLLSTGSDPGEAAYYDIKDKVNAWKKKNGLPTGSFAGEPSARSEVLYQYKLSLRYSDEKAAEKYLTKYLDMGGDMKGLSRSLDALDPLSQLNKADEGAFLADLPEKDQDLYDRALDYYYDVLLGP